jgi:hypothetical protein
MFKKLKNQIICFMEDNKRDNEHRPSGWHRRVQDIYIYHYQQQVNDAHDHHPELLRKLEYKK